jgi:glutathione S-transferase
MIVLYGMPLSTYCAKVQAVLRFKEIRYEDRQPPGGYGSDEYRAIVPMGTIPALVEDGFVISESEAIAEYLEECFPQPSLLGDDARQRAWIRSLSRIHDCWVEPQLRALYPIARAEERDVAAVQRHCDTFHQRLRALAEYADPAPFLAGSALSLADCAWPTTLLQAQMLFPALGGAFELPASLRDWRAALEAHPAIEPGIAPCRESMRRWMDDLGLHGP